MGPVVIENGYGYSELLGHVSGLTITETASGFVGYFKKCAKAELLGDGPIPDLFTIELDSFGDGSKIENIKINFIDSQGWVYFTALRPVTRL